MAVKIQIGIVNGAFSQKRKIFRQYQAFHPVLGVHLSTLKNIVRQKYLGAEDLMGLRICGNRRLHNADNFLSIGIEHKIPIKLYPGCAAWMGFDGQNIIVDRHTLD